MGDRFVIKHVFQRGELYESRVRSHLPPRLVCQYEIGKPTIPMEPTRLFAYTLMSDVLVFQSSSFLLCRATGVIPSVFDAVMTIDDLDRASLFRILDHWERLDTSHRQYGYEVLCESLTPIADVTTAMKAAINTPHKRTASFIEVAEMGLVDAGVLKEIGW